MKQRNVTFFIFTKVKINGIPYELKIAIKVQFNFVKILLTEFLGKEFLVNMYKV